MHTEMCCGAWPQFHDDRGLHGENNEYWNWAWTINFGKKTKLKNITFFDKDGTELYSGPWTYDSKKARGSQYAMVAPKEMSAEAWQELVYKRLKCTIETDELVDALKEEEKEETEK